MDDGWMMEKMFRYFPNIYESYQVQDYLDIYIYIINKKKDKYV
jgi:hypothetical protein